MFFTAPAVLCLDLFTKWVILQHSDSLPLEVVPGFFSITFVLNKGAAWGMFADWPDLPRRMALLCVSVVAVAVLARFMFKEAKDDLPSKVALSCILAGALGNIIDRVRFDSVVDFLDFYLGEYHWPAFNVADSAITIGVVVLLYRTTFSRGAVASS